MIQFKNICVQTSDSVTVLQDITFEIPKHKLTVICGPNGAGKTTLLRTLLGLQSVRSGEVTLSGQALKDLSSAEFSANLSWVPAVQTMPFSHTVREVVKWGLLNHRLSPEDTENEIISSLKVTDALHLIEKSINHLSQGEQKRVQISRAISTNAKTIVLDEPFAPLDHSSSLKVLKWIKESTHTNQKTVIASIHDIGIALNYADHVILLDKSRFLKAGTPLEVFQSKEFKTAFEIDLNILPTPHGIAYFVNPLNKE